jgi:hypothetical protein
MEHQRAEEIGKRGPAVRHGQVHLCGQNIRCSVEPRGEIEIAYQAAHQQHRATQPVCMFVRVCDGIFHQLPHLLIGGQYVVESGASRRQCMTPAQSCLHQVARPHALAHSIPKTISAIGLNPANTSLAASSPFHHALNRLEPVEVVAVHTAITDGERIPNRRP